MPLMQANSSPRYESVTPVLRVSDRGLRGVQQEVNRPFHFEDSQVVLQVSQSITRFPSNL